MAVENLDYRLLSKREVARFLGLTTRTVDRLVAARKIPFTSLPTGAGNSRRIRFDSRELEAWIRGGAVVVLAEGEE